MTPRIFTVLLGLFVVPSALLAAADQYPRPELLLEPAALARPDGAGKPDSAGNPDSAGEFVILDARSRADYEREHIEGARWVDHSQWKAAVNGEDAEGWCERLGGLGIDTESEVVVYDDNSMKDAARIWWILRYWGVENAKLLHGGWKTWKAEGFPTTDQEPPAAQPTSFDAQPRSQRMATKSDILGALPNNELQIIDARSEGEYCGTDARNNERAGAIPGAKHLQWSDLVDQDTHRFKPPEELRRLFDQAGIELDRPTASHCQSGGRASVMVFALELMGADDVRNYYRGWSEWGNDAATPIVPGEKPEA